jgi:hypothetical protein
VVSVVTCGIDRHERRIAELYKLLARPRSTTLEQLIALRAGRACIGSDQHDNRRAYQVEESPAGWLAVCRHAWWLCSWAAAGLVRADCGQDPEPQHLLDWHYVTMRLTVLGQAM